MASHMSDKELDEIYAFAIQLGKDAGKILMDRAQLRMSAPADVKEQKFVEKENAVDIVTKTDTGKFPPLVQSMAAFRSGDSDAKPVTVQMWRPLFTTP